jgi:hypothetical protein
MKRRQWTMELLPSVYSQQNVRLHFILRQMSMRITQAVIYVCRWTCNGSGV